MKKTTIWAIVIVAIIAIIGVIIWAYNKPPEQLNTDKTLKIGVIAPLTGFSQEIAREFTIEKQTKKLVGIYRKLM